MSETPTNVTPPPDLTYGYVDGRIILAIGDRSDGGRMPDPIPAEGLTVTFTPATTILKVAAPTPATVIKQPIVCGVDANGYLVDGQGARGVWLVAGVYKVTYSHPRATIPAHDIDVTTGHTEAAPLDLTTAMPPGGPVLTPSEYAELNGRLTILEAGGGGGGVTDHGALTGLNDDDHPNYLTEARGDARYVQGTDSRLTDARTPTAHASTHAAAGSDPLTVTSAQISDLTETVQDIVGAFLVAGTNVTVTYNDAANTFTINATASGGSTDPEVVRDVIGAAMVAGSGVQITVNDAGDTITIASTAVLPTRQVIAGTGLNGGGDLSADRTLAVTYGTTAGTSAQGNDSRITGAAQKSANLSDLSSASTARTNLGLGTAATTASTAYATAAQGATADAALAAAAAPELIRDTMATALVAGTNVTITPNDGADTITIAAGGGGAPAFLLASLPGGATRPPFNASTSPNLTGTARGTSYPWPAGVPIAGIAFNVTTAQSGATMNVGVYDCDAIGRPKTRLNLTTGIDVSTTGRKMVYFSATPTGGLLWTFFKCSSDGDVVQVDGYSNNAINPFVAVGTSNWEAQRGCKIDPSLPSDATASFAVDADWWAQPGFHILFPT